MTESFDLIGLCLWSVVIVVGLLILRFFLSFAQARGKRKAQAIDQEKVNEESLMSGPDETGVNEMLPDEIWEEIRRIVDSKTGVQLPQLKTMKERIKSIPDEERPKYLQNLVPIFIDALKESTTMHLDASLRWDEFLLGEVLGLSELDVGLTIGEMKLEKGLAAYSRQYELLEDYRKRLPNRTFVMDYFEIRSLTRLWNEVYKDEQAIPPEIPTPQQMAMLLLKPPSSEDISQEDWEEWEEEE